MIYLEFHFSPISTPEKNTS